MPGLQVSPEKKSLKKKIVNRILLKTQDPEVVVYPCGAVGLMLNSTL